MPNNFRLTGNVYVSKEGNDANSGLTPELPKLTVQAGLTLLGANQTMIIGAGVYKEDLSKSVSVNANYYLVGDGTVILQGNNTKFLFFGNGTGNAYPGLLLTNINVIDMLVYAQTNTGGGNLSTGIYFNNCVLQRCTIYPYLYSTFGFASTIISFSKSILINCVSQIYSSDTGSGNTSIINFFSSILINFQFIPAYPTTAALSTIGINTLKDCYVDSTSVLWLANGITAQNCNFNNIQGKLLMRSNGAVSGANSNGVAQSFAAHRIDYPTYNVNSISADPLFNDVQNLNFTLQATSPHIRGASDFISNIGGTEYAVYMKASNAELTSGATITNLTLQGNNSYVITAPNTTGSIISAPKLLQWPRTKPLTRLEWTGNLEFNKSVTAGLQGNQNVPDYETATSGAAAQPDRLCIKMRFSTQQTQPSTSGEWDNDGLWTAGEYRLFEINSKPKVDVNGLGNGSSSYVEFSGLGDIVPSWVQIDVILINNYNP